MNNDSFLRVERQKLSKTGLDADSVRQILKNAELRMSFGVARTRRFAGRFAEFHEADLGRAAATHALVKRGSAEAGLCERYLPSTIVLEDPSGAACMPGGDWPCGLSAGAPPVVVSRGPVEPCGCCSMCCWCAR